MAERRSFLPLLCYWILLPALVIGLGRGLDRLLGLTLFGVGVPSAGLAGLLIGVGLALIGKAARDLEVLGEGTMGGHRPPRRLVTEGVYARTRHPVHLGYTLAALGVLLLVGSPAAVLYVFPAFVAGQLWFLKRVEEPRLEERFGDAFRAYRSRVPLFLPRLFLRRGGP